MAEDYYQTLGLARDATQADIQKAYRSLARKYHPDLNPDDKSAKQKFQAVQTAFDVLNDPQKRELYDRYGASFEQLGSGGGPRPGASGTWHPQAGAGQPEYDFSAMFGGDRFGEGGGGFADMFAQFRQAAQPGKGPRAAAGGKARGPDVKYELHVPFNTAVLGGQAQVQVDRGGKLERLEIKIPTGIDDGQTIRLRGQGGPSSGRGPAGDLLITIRVEPHPCFTRKDDNLSVKVPVTLAEAALGAKIDVPTPRGTVALNVPAGSSSGTKLRIRGQGVAAPERPAGDLFAELAIVLPKALDAEAQQALRRLQERYPQEPRRELRW